jgi:DNA-sulfur modification-associated
VPISYLARSGIRFFNSLVVVLLPNSENQQEFWDYSEVKSSGRVIEKWVNLQLYKGVSRVVIDGQHRLLALKKYWDVRINPEHMSANEKSEGYDCSDSFDIPVVYIVFKDLGRVGCVNDSSSESIRSQDSFRHVNSASSAASNSRCVGASKSQVFDGSLTIAG